MGLFETDPQNLEDGAASVEGHLDKLKQFYQVPVVFTPFASIRYSSLNVNYQQLVTS